MKRTIFTLVVAGAFMLGGSPVVNADECFDHQHIKNLARALKDKRQSKEAGDQAPKQVVPGDQGDQQDAKADHQDHPVTGGSVPSIPDWSTWKCEIRHTSHDTIETYECHGPDGSQMSRILLKLRGATKPFLIGWGYDERATNPREKSYSALYKDGGWIVGARGTGFTAVDGRNSITFYIFLDEDFSVREEIEIKLPEGHLVKLRT